MRALVPLLISLAFGGHAAALHIPTAQDALSAASHLLDELNDLASGATGITPQNVLTPASDIGMHALSTDEFTVLTSPLHPNHKVRIKSTKGWCDPGVKSYSGYIDTGGGKELFFYFFESRNDPAKDPVVMWINGGPGCASEMGLFMELGPCTIRDGPKNATDTEINPHSWTNKANMFFLDEPVDVGFSQSKHGQLVDTTEKAAEDVAAFISIFFDTFKEFSGRAFHMSGESYGGRYLPVFASAVYDNNAALIAAGKEPINLQSVLIGNGITDFYSTTESFFPFQCTNHHDLNRTVLPIGACVELAEVVPKCHKMFKQGCIESKDYTECAIAVNFCSTILRGSVSRAELNPYDVSKKCTQEQLSKFLCYEDTAKVKTYLDLPDVRKVLGVDKDKGSYETCSWRVNGAFAAQLDNANPTWLYVSQLLERRIRVLNYVGTLDFVCNYMGNEKWMEALSWSGKQGYNDAKKRDWHGPDGKVAGWTKSHGDLSMLTIYNAGHMVPMDQPENAATFFEKWLEGGTPE